MKNEKYSQADRTYHFFYFSMRMMRLENYRDIIKNKTQFYKKERLLQKKITFKVKK